MYWVLYIHNSEQGKGSFLNIILRNKSALSFGPLTKPRIYRNPITNMYTHILTLVSTLLVYFLYLLDCTIQKC